MMDTDSGGPREGPRPWCPRNEKYAARVREAFLSGDSPSSSTTRAGAASA
jgi:hypothetical protein